MFKIELNEEQKARADEREAREAVEKAEAQEQRRREKCVELACGLEETRAENIASTAERIYEYVYGRREG
jgi:hypothetical protein